MLRTLAVSNYRTLRDLIIPLDRVTVITGANGTGKSNLYRALRLLAETSRNGLVAAMAREGGLPAAMWAGPGSAARLTGRCPQAPEPPNLDPSLLRLGFGGDDFGYATDLGFPGGVTMFCRDPVVKTEHVWAGPVLRASTVLAQRHGALMVVDDGKYAAGLPVNPYDSMLAEFADPGAAPELHRLRDRMRGWRFYDHIRVDGGAPARVSRVGTFTPALAADGSDLAAAVQTIIENGHKEGFDEAIYDAFPGCRVSVAEVGGRFEVSWHQPGLHRELGAAELSDGTLRYLLLVTAVYTPRPPELLVFNEPETSLHPDLFVPLAHLILAASQRTQILVVSHADEVIETLADVDGVALVELIKRDGETRVRGQGVLDRPAWKWST